MSRLLSVWNFIRRHKYLITVFVFSIIIGFVDENSMLRRVSNLREINQLHEEIGKFKAEYQESTTRLNELTANPEALEKVAREKYLMKKPNEDIYVFQEEEE
ncbi:MAG: septum formation initiator family protein [Bacteroides sp.]